MAITHDLQLKPSLLHNWRGVQQRDANPLKASQDDVDPNNAVTHEEMSKGTFAKTLLLMLLDYYQEERYYDQSRKLQHELHDSLFLAMLKMLLSHYRHRQVDNDDEYFQELSKDKEEARHLFEQMVEHNKENMEVNDHVGNDALIVSILAKQTPETLSKMDQFAKGVLERIRPKSNSYGA